MTMPFSAARALATWVFFVRTLVFGARRSRFPSLLAVFLLGLFAQSASAATRIIYVDSSAAANGTGISWSQAYNNLNSAIDSADPTLANPVEIWLKNGVYKPIGTGRTASFALKSYLTLRGGFLGSESTPDARPSVASAASFTVLSGDIGTPQIDSVTSTTQVNNIAALTYRVNTAGAVDNCYNVVRATDVVAAALDRLVIAGGFADGGALTALEIETMLQPTASDGGGFRSPVDPRANGGAIFAVNAGLDLGDCFIVGNYARGIGGGVVVRGGYLALHTSKIVGNISGLAGGGVAMQGALSPNFFANTFYGNTASLFGGGIYIQADTSNKMVKGYISNLITSIAMGTFSDPTASSFDGKANQDAINLANVQRTGLALGQAVASFVAAKLVSKVISGVILALKTSASSFTTPYGAISGLVTAMDFGVALAVFLGADPNSAFVKGYTKFSEAFAAYATPVGLANTIITAIFGNRGPNYEKRATDLRVKDYADNQNHDAAIVVGDSRFERNYSGGMGGAVTVIHATVNFDRTAFVDNSATFGAGAGLFVGYNDVNAESCLFLRNTAKRGHSAIATAFRSVNRLINNTIINNHSDEAKGYAVGVDAGADAVIANSILWGNTNGSITDSANVNRAGGADVVAIRHNDLDADGLRVWNDAGDNHAQWTGVLDVRNTNIQSFNRLALGGFQFRDRIVIPGQLTGYGETDTEKFNLADTYANNLKAGYPNVGEGIRQDVMGANRGNMSRDPLLIQDYYPIPSAPVVGAGNMIFSKRGSDLVGQIRVRDQIDMGAIESDYTFPGGTTIYVNRNVSASGDGLTWGTAFKTLREALNSPLSAGGQIWIAGGTYTPTLDNDRNSAPTLRPGVSMYGGFPNSGSPTMAQRNLSAYPVILSGNIGSSSVATDNSKTLLIANTGNSTIPRVIDGITFSDANGGSAAVLLSAPTLIKNSTFVNNASGRALLLTDPANLKDAVTVQIVDSRFEDNIGGGIDATVYNLELIRTDFFENTQATEGGAVYHHLESASDTAGNLRIERCVFYGNSSIAGPGGGLSYKGKTLSIAQSTFADNTAQLANGDPSNRAGAGIWWTTASASPRNLTLLNTILYGNRLTGTFSPTTLELQQFGLPDVLGSSTLTKRIEGNDIEGLALLATRGGVAWESNFDYDPFFTNAVAHDFTLKPGSMLLNRVLPYTSGTETVVAFGNGGDIGARENPTIAGDYSPFDLVFTTLPPTNDALKFTLTNGFTVQDILTYKWEVRRPDSDRFVTVTNDAYTSGAGTATLTFSSPPRNWNGSAYRLRLHTTLADYFSQEFTLNVSPGKLFVKTTATGTRDGSSWANATTLSDALTAASAGTQVWIAKGNYSIVPTKLAAGVRLFAGFVGTETLTTQRTIAPADTVITITGADVGFTIIGTSSVDPAFDNFTLKAAIGKNPVVQAAGTSVTFSNIRVDGLSYSVLKLTRGTANVNDSYFTNVPVTLFRAVNSTVNIVRSQFLACGLPETQTDAGVLSTIDSYVTISESRFERNYGIYGGAIAHIRGPDLGLGRLDVSRCTFIANQAQSNGGAIYAATLNAVAVNNSLFVRNRAGGSGGAIHTTNGGYGPYSSTLLNHDTFYDNQSSGNGSVVIAGYGSSLTNSLVYDLSSESSSVTSSITLVNTYIANYRGYYQTALQSYAAKPLFVDEAKDDFRLQPSSPLINVGGTDDNVSGGVDLLGNPRRYANGQADVGCYELQAPGGTPLQLATAPANTTIYEFAPVSFSTSTPNIYPYAQNGNFSWQYFDGTIWRPISDQAGWNVNGYLYWGGGSTISRSATTAEMDGQRMRLVSDIASNAFVEFTINFVPRNVIRVDRRVSNSGNGLSWTTPFKTIAQGLAAAGTYTDVWVVSGDYPETSLTLQNGARLYTGFAGTETSIAQRNNTTNPVRLQGSASFFDLNPADPNTIPPIAFNIITAPQNRSVYVEKPVSFTAVRAAGTTASFVWQYRSGSSWLPIANLAGWTVSGSNETSTLAHAAPPQSANNLVIRAVLNGTPETSFLATLTVKPRVIRYVNLNAYSSGDGSSWGSAFQTIREALAVSDEGTDLWIVGGSYNETEVRQIEGVRYYAGFTGSETSVTQRNAATRIVSIVGPGGQFDLDASTAGPGLFQIATSPRSINGYANRPVAFYATRAAGATAPLEWQYLAGSTWTSVSGLTGWSVTDNGTTTILSNTAASTTHNGLQFRVRIAATGEHSFAAKLTVATRTVLRVDGRVADYQGDGSSWVSAYKTISGAVANANASTDIWIATGTYSESWLAIPPGTSLYGGFAGNETALAARNATTNPVTIQDQGGRVFMLGSGSEFDVTVLDGLRFDAGSGSNEAAVSVGIAWPIFNNVTITGRNLGVLLESDSRATFTNSRFQQNTTAIQATNGSTVAIRNSTFVSNGTGLLLDNGMGSMVFTSTFESNTGRAIASAPGLVIDQATFLANARSINFYSGTAKSLVNGTDIEASTVYGIQTDAPIHVSDSTFTTNTLSLSITSPTAPSTSTVTGSLFEGAGQAIQSPAGLLIENTAFENVTTGLVVTGSSVNNARSTTLNRTTFTGITAQAVVGQVGEFLVDRSAFTANNASGPLVQLDYSNAIGRFTNTRFTDNVLSGAAVVRFNGNLLVFDQVTMANNNTGTLAGAITRRTANGGSLYIRNSILWNNRANASGSTIEFQQLGSLNAQQISVINSIVEGLSVFAGTGNIAFDPLFVSPTAGNYALQAASPAIDVAVPYIAPSLDLAGAARIQSTAADFGAYESAFVRAAQPASLNSNLASRTLITGDSAIWNVTLPASSTNTVTWQVNRGSGFVDVIADANHALTSINGSNTLSVYGDLAISGYVYRALVRSGSAVLYTTPSATFTVNIRPTIYVNAAATGTNNGTSWTNAYNSLATALNNAPSFADIKVAGGVYRPVSGSTFSLRRRQHLTGGWNASNNTRNLETQPTTLSLVNGSFTTTSAIMTANTDQGSVDGLTMLDGFIFTGGGRGLVLTDGAVVSNSDFTNLTGTAVTGGSGSFQFTNCDFSGNIGGAINLSSASIASTLVIADSTFTNNSSASTTSTAATALNLNNNISASIVRSSFVGNISTGSGGTVLGGKLDIRQSLFAKNIGLVTNGAGTINTTGDSTLTNVTIVDNQSRITSAVTGVNITIRNSILWGNTSSNMTVERAQVSATNATLEYVTIQNLFSYGGTQLTNFDPRFVDSANGDYRLKSDSPAINAGAASFVNNGELDLVGNNRNQLGAPDRGAYETAAATETYYDFNFPATLSGPPESRFTLSRALPPGYNSNWQYLDLDGVTWRDFIGSPAAAGPANVARGFMIYYDYNSRTTTLYITATLAGANNRQFRLQLSNGGIGYQSPPVTVVVTPLEVIYVDPSRPTSGAGTSWSTAYRTLTEALSNITLSRRIIYVAQGEQRGPFTIPNNVQIYGGFPSGGSTFETRNIASYPTVFTGLPAINGQPRATRVVSFATSNDTGESVLDGVTVSDGQTGVYVENASPALRNLVVTGHSATGLVLINAFGRVESSRFENNTGVDGGGIRITNGSPVLDRLTIRGNTATTGGGINAYSSFTLTSSLISGNVATGLGGGIFSTLYPQFSQVTIAGNRANASAAIHVNGNTVTLRNSIVWGNVATVTSNDPQLAPASGFSLDRVTVEQTSLTTGLITANPWCIAPVAAASAPTTTGDYRLATVSPARDAGNNAVVTSLPLDLVAAPRVANTTVDLGAYEATDAPSTAFVINTQPSAIAFRRDLTGNTFSIAATGSTNVIWQIAGSDGVWVSLVGNASFSGANTATLTVVNATYALNGNRIRAVLTGADSRSLTSAERVLTVYSPRYYVNAAAASAGDGLTWTTAFKSLASALSTIPYDVEGTEIWIAGGDYTPVTAFNLNAGLSLFGGFAGTETLLTQRVAGAHVTSFVGASAQPIVVNLLATNPTGLGVNLDGITIRDSAGLGLSNTVGRTLTLEGMRFTGLDRAIASANSPLIIRHTEIRGNGTTTTDAAPLMINGGTLVIENTLFAGNRTNYVSGAYINAPSILRHVTFAGNRGRNEAVNFWNTNNQTYNTIISGNRDLNDNVVTMYAYNLYVGRFNVIEDYSSYKKFPVAEANQAIDPQFTAPVAASLAPTTAGDYTLKPASLAIDAGNNAISTTSTVDLAGSPRQSGLFVDVGAYESQASGLYTLTTQPVSAPASPIAPAIFTVGASRPATFAWEVSTDSGANYTTITGATSATLSIAGSPEVDARLYRARVQFATGPALVSNAATLTYVNVTATASASAGFSTPATFTSTATAPVASYQWQVKIGNAAFVDVVSETASTLSVLADPTFTNRSYRLKATFAAGPVVLSNVVAYNYVNVVPTPAAFVAASGSLSFGITGGINTASLNDSSLSVQAGFSGRHTLALGDFTATFSTDKVTTTLTFAEPFHAGERVQFTTTDAVRRLDEIGVRPRVWEFIAPTNSGSGFFDTQVTPDGAPSGSTALALGDVDGNGSIDLLLAGPDGLRVWNNNGLGTLTAAGSTFGNAGVTTLALGSLTTTAALDAVAINASGDLEIWSNNGADTFALTQTITGLGATAVALSDLDADGDLDLIVATTTGNRVYLNSGAGTFVLGTTFGSGDAPSIALGDLDLDGTIDAVIAGPSGSSIWRNNGAGVFIQVSNAPAANRVVLGHFDTDATLDLFYVKAGSASGVWVNNGNFSFTNRSGPGSGSATTLAVGDTDGDGRADLVLTDATGATAAWLAQSNASVQHVDDQLQIAFGATAELADLDGDGSLDLIGFDAAGRPTVSLYRVVTSRADEDNDAAITAAGFLREGGPGVTNVHIATLPSPADGTLLTAALAPVNVGDTFTLSQAATLIYRPTPNANGFNSFTWSLTAGGAPLPYWILIRSVEDDVTPTADHITVNQGATATTLDGNATSVLANDINSDSGTVLAASIVQRPAHGVLTLNADGTFSYVHDNSETRTDSFTYRATNTTSNRFATTSVTITIVNVNAAPASITFTDAAGTRYTRQDAGQVIGALTATDPDPEDAGLLTFSLVAGNGSTNNADFVIDGNTLKTASVIATADGLTRNIRVRVSDPAGLSFERELTIVFTRAPDAVANAVSTNEDTALPITLSGLGGANALSYEVVTQPLHGVITGTAPALVYVPNVDYNGSDSFTFRVTDGPQTSPAATVAITVNAVNDVPVLAPVDTVTTNEDTPAVITIISSDIEGDAVTLSQFTGPSRGSLSITGHTVTYTSLPDHNGSDSFTIRGTDAQGGVSREITILVNVLPTPDAPQIFPAQDRAVTLEKGQSFTMDHTFYDADGDDVSFRIVTQPAEGTLSINGGSITYNPPPQFAGTVSYSYVATDGTLDSATVSVTATVFDPPPVAFSETLHIVQRASGSWFLQGRDPQLDPVDFVVITPFAHGTYNLQYEVPSQGVYKNVINYTPDPSFSGTDTLTYVSRDGNGNISAPATITFEVGHINLVPTAAPVTVSKSGLSTNATFNLGGSNPEGTALTYRLLTLPIHGTLTFADGSPVFIDTPFAADATSLIYTPSVTPFAGTDSFTYVTNDGEDDSAPATVTLEFLRDLRDPLAMPDNAVVYRGLETYIPVLANDTDAWGSPLRITAVTNGAHGTVSIAPDENSVSGQRVLYTHTNDSTDTTDSFTYTVSNDERSSTVTVSVIITDHVIEVTSSADNGPGTLREAIATVNHFGNRYAANTTDTIEWRIVLRGLPPGEVHNISSVGDTNALLGDSYYALNVGHTTIESTFPITLSPRGYAAEARFFRIALGAELTIKGPITFTGGIAHHGGAFYNEGRLTLDQGVILTGNAAIASDDATEPGLGGAIYQRNGILKLFAVQLTGNLAGDGGGLYQVGDGALPVPTRFTTDPIYESSSAVIANGAVFSGHGDAKDFRSVTINGGTADFLATNLTAASPTAPWVDVVPTDVVRTQYKHTIPVLLNPGQTLSVTGIGNNATSVTGTGNTRTITSTGATYDGYPPVAIAGGGGVTFRRVFNFTYDDNASHAAITRDDMFAVSTIYTPVVLDVLANDEQPDGIGLSIASYTQPALGYVTTNQFGQLTFTSYGSLDGGEDSFTYTLFSGGTATVRIKRTATTVNVADAASLRATLALANTYNAQPWTIRPTAALIETDSVGETSANFGTSAFVITGNVTFDGSALEDAKLRRADTAPAMRLFRVAPGASLTLRKLTVENGSAVLGGAIYNEGTVLIDSSTLQENTAHKGGAIYSDAATLTVSASMLLNNSATDVSETDLGFGGAVYQRNGTVLFDGSYIADNSANNGGALYAEGTSGATATFDGSYLSNFASLADLAGTGSVNFHSSSSLVGRVDGPSISAMNDINLATYTINGVSYAEAITYFTNEDVQNLAIYVHSSQQGIIADGDITQDFTDGIRRLRVTPVASGVTNFTLTASSGSINYTEHFRVLANTGAVANPTVYPNVGETYPQGSTIIDPINGLAPASDPYGLPLTIVSLTTPAHGTAVITSDNKILYTHTGAIDATGTDEFFFTVSNGFGGTATNGIQIQLKSIVKTVTNVYELRTAIEFAATTPTVPWQIKIMDTTGLPWTASGYFSGNNTNGYYSAYKIVGNVTLDASGSPGFILDLPPAGRFGPPQRHFVVLPGSTLTLKNLQLQNGAGYGSGGPALGGSILNYGTLIADTVVFQSNVFYSANGQGGAIHNAGGTATLTDCSFNSNQAGAAGGAIYSVNGKLTLVRPTFSGNTAPIAPNVYLFGDGAVADIVFSSVSASGTVFATANGGSITSGGQAITSALATDDTFVRPAGQLLKISIASLLANDNVLLPNGVDLTQFDSASSGGVAVTRSGGFLLYHADAAFAAADSFTYTITDRFGEVTTATVNITLSAPASTPSDTTVSIAASETGGFDVRLVGVPGRTYEVQVSTDLATWTRLVDGVADAQGVYTVHDPITPPAGTGRFYRAVYTRE